MFGAAERHTVAAGGCIVAGGVGAEVEAERPGGRFMMLAEGGDGSRGGSAGRLSGII
jgi:hypothetical protein